MVERIRESDFTGFETGSVNDSGWTFGDMVCIGRDSS